MTESLVTRDITSRPFPWEDGWFDHALACGVFHFFSHPGFIFEEVYRLIRPQGILCFTHQLATRAESDVQERVMESVPVFAHKPSFIGELAADTGFTLKKPFCFTCIPLPNHQTGFYSGPVWFKNPMHDHESAGHRPI